MALFICLLSLQSFRAWLSNTKTKSWVHIADLPSMMTTLMSLVVHKSCSSIQGFASAVYGTQTLCTCILVSAGGQGWVGHPVLTIKAETFEEAPGTLRRNAVCLSFLRGDLLMGAFVIGIAINAYIPLGAVTFPASSPSALAVKWGSPRGIASRSRPGSSTISISEL